MTGTAGGRQARERLVALVHADLVGPAGGRDETLRERPDKRYLMGMLFPQNATAGAALADEEEVDGSGAEVGPDDSQEEEGLESPTDLMFQKLPASVGLSFAVMDARDLVLDVTVDGACYERAEAAATSGRRRASARWQRVALAPQGGQSVRLAFGSGRRASETVLGGRATLLAELRRGADGSQVVTVSLRNESKLESEDERFRPEDVIYQVALQVLPSSPAMRWPSPQRLAEDDEEDELLLQYRHRVPFAVGHGCAAGWLEEGNHATRLWLDFLPRSEVAPVTTDIADLPQDVAAWLALQMLQSSRATPETLGPALTRFVDEYARWRRDLGMEEVPAGMVEARDRILGRIDDAIDRMRAGVALLARGGEVLRCFRLANRAMLMQMDYADRVAAVEQRGQAPAPAGVSDPDAPALAGRRWRPFQLAFFLMSLPGLWDEEHPDRDIVDLIWFPTGGGKTEAYLATAAFEMIRRRMQHGTGGGGTAILMRYTLRLLTQQQFQRAAHLISALEDLREADPATLGREPFGLGLWIGSGATPGSFRKAREEFLTRVVNQPGSTATNPFALLSCPCCGTRLVPSDKPELSTDGVGIRSTEAEFAFFCPDTRCHRHDSIPVQVIDEGLYQSPPTLLLGTLDKFAMLAWNEKAAAFFGRGRQGTRMPPSMVIQDELHLISGPLGTIAGVYEAAIDTVIRDAGGRPKIVCSTATIRRAADQARSLYARGVAVFPPPGIDASDSYFSRAVSDRPGRLYLGAMAQGHTPTFSVVMTASSLLQAAADVAVDEAARDTWWTLVAYHNSRRELGKTLTLARDDIPARIASLGQDTGRPPREVERVEQLSANVPGPEIPSVLDRLKIERDSGQAVDFLGCTNMLSVGVDVSRLGLMLMVGQPKTTSEYIQATSRVGRDPRRLPGVVLCLYMGTKPRDRSHYETFRGYHEALYRQVEPTSVTPYALPARRRALHAAVVAALRMAVPELGGNADAHRFGAGDAAPARVLRQLLQRMVAADDRERAGIEADLQAFLDEWEHAAGPRLRYSTARNSSSYRPLLKRFGESRATEGRETLQSMRHVDVGVRVRVWGQKKAEGPAK